MIRIDMPMRSRVVLVAVSLLAAFPFLLVELFPSALYRVMDASDYLVFHNTVEFFSVMVSLSIFGAAWFSHEQSGDRHTLFLGVAFLGIGLMDFMHTMGYPGMPSFITPNSPNKSTQFWIAVRLFGAASFLASGFVGKEGWSRRLGRWPLFAAVLAVTGAVFVLVTFFSDALPATFIPGYGLTPFKKGAEWLIIILLFLAIAVYLRRLNVSEKVHYRCFVCAFVLCIFSELVFTVYKSVYDTYNVLGHLYKLIAFAMIYHGVFAAAVQRPYGELHQALEELRLTNDVLRHIINSIPQSIFWKDRESVYMGCNREFAAGAGLSDPSAVVGKTDRDLPWTDEECEGYLADDRAVMESGRAKMHIIENLTQADGSMIWIDTSKMPLRDKGGAIWGVLGVYEDVTEKKLHAERLSDALQFNQEIINSAREGIVVYDRELRYLVWNPYMEELSGFKASEVLGRRVDEVFPKLKEDGLVARLEELMGGGAPVTLEFGGRDAAGREIWLSDASAPLRSASGEVVGVIATVRDITERRAIEEQLRQAQKLESVGRLAGGVAHDFNNKLTVILGNAELASFKTEEPALKEHLGQIVKAAEQSRDITAQLLAFSRQQVITPKPVQVNAILEELRKSLGRLIGEHIAIVVVPGEGLWQINIDPVQLDQIIMNLAVNARDAMPQGGTITIATGNCELREPPPGSPGVAPGGFVRIECRDTGEGMDAETRRHIFEPFYTTKRQGKGTGLGLATVYGIVTQNGGFIEVETELGRGSAFKVFFPRCTAERCREPEPPAPVPARGSGTVLLVEDEEMVRDLTMSMLESMGYRCLAIADPREALVVAENPEVEIDLVLTDVLMPGMRGQEMMEALRRVRPGAKCIYMSGYTAAILDDDSVRREGAAFLKKPFQMEELAKLVQEVLSGKGPEQEG